MSGRGRQRTRARTATLGLAALAATGALLLSGCLQNPNQVGAASGGGDSLANNAEVDGDKVVRIFGEEIRVRASIHTIGGLSAHADQAALLNWLKHFETAPQRTFVVHGEAQTACGFADRIADERGWSVEAPAPGTRIDL